MRSSTFSSLAILASSLLVREAFAGPLGKRALITDNVIVTEEIVVTVGPDGSLQTGAAKAIGTTTIHGSVVITTVRPVSTIEDLPSSAPVAVPEPATTPATSSTPEPAVFKEKAEPTTSAAAKAVQAPVEAPVSVAPTTTSTPAVVAPAPAPTTLAKVVSSAAAPVASVISSAVSSGSSGSGKRGVAYNDASFLSAFTGNPNIKWCYNWGGTTQDVPSQFEYVPMLWGIGEHANNWEKFADKAIAAGSKHLLAFNEPDHAEQANIGFADAASAYLQYMQPYAGKVKLGSPAVTNGGSPMGLAWLESFLGSCTTCTVDFIAIHWYNGGDASAFKEYVQKAYKSGGNRPVWITEFQAPGSVAEQAAWLAEVLPWLDQQDFVERYAYFMASDGIMMSGSGLSALGNAYVSV